MSEYQSVYESRGLIGLTPEQLLIIADEVCHQHHSNINLLQSQQSQMLPVNTQGHKCDTPTPAKRVGR